MQVENFQNTPDLTQQTQGYNSNESHLQEENYPQYFQTTYFL